MVIGAECDKISMRVIRAAAAASGKSVSAMPLSAKSTQRSLWAIRVEDEKQRNILLYVTLLFTNFHFRSAGFLLRL